MFKKIVITTIMIAVILSSSAVALAGHPQETVDEKAVAKAQTLRAQAEKMKSSSSKAEQRKADALLTRAADMETNAHKLNGKCKHGSHKDIETIKKRHRNCEECHVDDIKNGDCARVSGAHKHYYCYCDC